MHLHTYACSAPDLQNSAIFHTHKNKAEIFIDITSVEEWNKTAN